MILKHVTIEPDFEQMMMDTTIVRVHQHGAGAKTGKASKRSDDEKDSQHVQGSFDVDLDEVMAEISLRTDSSRKSENRLETKREA